MAYDTCDTYAYDSLWNFQLFMLPKATSEAVLYVIIMVRIDFFLMPNPLYTIVVYNLSVHLSS